MHLALEYIEYPADWYNLDVKLFKIKLDKLGRQYNALAGFNRNKLIIDRADMVLAFWGGSPGTKHSLDLAKEQKKPTFIHYV